MTLEELSLKYKQLKDQYDSRRKDLADATEDMKSAERELMEGMQGAGLDSFKNSYGLFTIGHRTSVRLPATPEAWVLFWNHLREKGDEEALKTVNSQKLNSWYKSEYEIAKEEGNIDFSVPGLEEPTISEYISMRKV